MPIALRTDFDAASVRSAARGSKDDAQTRRLLTLEVIYAAEAARIGGILKALRDTLAPAQLSNAILATHPIEHDADRVFGREVPAGLPPNVGHHPLSRGPWPAIF